jgi:hypothetical protein
MIVHGLIALLSGVVGLTLLRAAWFLVRADMRDYRRDYPNSKAVFMGRANCRGGRKSMLLNQKNGRIEFH